MELKHSPGLDPIPDNKKDEARASLDANPDLQSILASESPTEVRERVFQSYHIDSTKRFTLLDRAILAEAVDRWNKARTERQRE